MTVRFLVVFNALLFLGLAYFGFDRTLDSVATDFHGLFWLADRFLFQSGTRWAQHHDAFKAIIGLLLFGWFAFSGVIGVLWGFGLLRGSRKLW